MKRKIYITALFVVFIFSGSIIIRNTLFVSNDDTGIRNINWNIGLKELEKKEGQSEDVSYTKTTNNNFVEYTQYLDFPVHIEYRFVKDSLEMIVIYYDVDMEKDWIIILQKIYDIEGKAFANSKQSKKGQSYVRTWQNNNNTYKLTCDFKKCEIYMTVCKS